MNGKLFNNLLYALDEHDDINYLNNVTISLCRTSVDIIVLDDYLIDVGEQDKISYLNILEKYDSSIQSWILVTSMSIK
ncbi:unnamed protein product [Rotaria sp. Silwood1]|nr:unnamed protein product [Rotaria sp. Silwood1]CAF4759680.1 unnamed protein product [Rotaria sp. Silwood1]CAF4937084.1 unnamed protein product [Rotaria sp. Silwood1]